MFFDTVPFCDKYDYQIMRLLTSGGRPVRLENPRMDDDSWEIIQKCWKAKPSERPAMEQLVKTMAPRAALITLLNQVYTVVFPCHHFTTYDLHITPVNDPQWFKN